MIDPMHLASVKRVRSAFQPNS